MRSSKFFVAILVLSVIGFSAGCGGGGQGLRIPNNPLVITSSSLPTLLSGEVIDWEIPLDGGCAPGNYTVEVISGLLPDGVITVQGTEHHLRGTILKDGIFDFVIKVTDTNCPQPFPTATMAFHWEVNKGEVRIVGATPGIIPNAQFEDPLKHPNQPGPDGVLGTPDDVTVDALETIVYSTTTAYVLTVAGGTPPYSCAVIDDPLDPNDGNLPFGTGLAPNSCSIVGSPTEVLSSGPFLITFEVTDVNNNKSRRKLQWKIDTPAIIMATSSLANGIAGQTYSDALQVVDGVPPFRFELTDNAPGDDGDPDTTDNVNDDIDYVPGATPLILSWADTTAGREFQLTGGASGGPAADNARLSTTTGRPWGQYPAETDNATALGPMPSEGITFREATGGFSGVPRRRGVYTLYAHAWSTVVPNERGQHGFKALTMTIATAASGPNAFDMNPVIIDESTFNPTAPHGTLGEAEFGVPYNPDQATDSALGLLLSGIGGVPQDELTDSPHFADQNPSFTEVAGEYTWGYDDDGTPLPGMSLFAANRWGTGATAPGDANLLERSGLRTVNFSIEDEQLPLSVRAAETTKTRTFEVSVGPDVSIITYSTTSETGTDFWWRGSSHDMNDTAMIVQKMELFADGSATRNDLESSDLAANTDVPSIAFAAAPANPLGALLSGDTGGDATLDILRPTVVATGWWDDQFQMNPRGARPGAHTDMGRTDSYVGQFGSSWTNTGNFQLDVPSIDLPDVGLGTTDPSHDPSTGVYHNGGQMYFFESASRYGMFIVRPDAKVYVPYAKEKSPGGTSGEGFGDGLLKTVNGAGNVVHSAFRTVQCTVSPDGKIAAFKLKNNITDLFEHADISRILFVSLTGEKIFAGGTATYRVVTTNATATTGGGNLVLQAGSMALTNDRLYFVYLTRTAFGTSTSTSPLYQQSWQSLFFVGCEIVTGSPALLSSTAAAWTQTAGNPMQGVTHHHGPYVSSSRGNMAESSGWASDDAIPYHRYWHESGMNLMEHGQAPSPFRVSANGKSVAFFAGSDYTGFSYDESSVYSSYVWVDTAGTGPVQITTTRRHHTNGSARSHQIVYGPNEYNNWGTFTGPTPGLEIRDDGLAVAATYNTTSSACSACSYSTSSQRWADAREDIEVMVATGAGGTNWSTNSQTQVTGLTFGGSHLWRFGSLAFTSSGDGIVFWGGAPMQNATTSASSSQIRCYHFFGSYYQYKLGDSNKVTGILATTNGGNPDGSGKVYTNTAPFNPGATTGRNNRYGVMQPMGGFMSKNRDFLYVCNSGPLSSSDGTCVKLVGMNVRSTNSANNINSHVDGRGFAIGNWPSRRGFMTGWYQYYWSGATQMHRDGYMPQKMQGLGQQVMAKDTGWVFFGSNNQYQGPTQGTSTSDGVFPYPCYYNYGNSYGGVMLMGFNAEVGGPISQLGKASWVATGTASSPRHMLNHIEVTRDGTSLVWQFANNNDHLRNTEQIRGTRDISFDATTGAMHAGFDREADSTAFEASNGRAGESYTISGNDIYYAYKSSSGNETDKYFTRQRWDTTLPTPAWQKTAVTTSTGTGRINILWTGR